VKVLFDTNAFLAAHTEPERLGPHLAAIEHPDTVRLVSAVVGWEITIMHGLGRLELPEPPQRWVPHMVRAGAMTTVAVDLDHALAVGALPLHHRDPFDRLLIATAIALDVPILTSDRVFEDYDVEILGY
jgi:PIN domain nuclease of toxin-antitoxin system